MYTVSWLVLLPLTLTVPAVPLATYPADTVGVTLWLALTEAVMRPPDDTLIVGLAVMVVAGVVAEPLGIAFTVTLTSSNPSYPASAVMEAVCCDVDGVYVALFVCKVGVGAAGLV